MDLTPHVDRLGRELVGLLETADDDARDVVDRVIGGLDSAIRLSFLEALSAAADEIARELAPGSVELRLRGRDPEFVVTAPPPEPAEDQSAPVSDAALGAEEGATARINLRLSDPLKAAVEEAAAREGRSVNAWLVRVVSGALRQQVGEPPMSRGTPGAQRFTGWVQ